MQASTGEAPLLYTAEQTAQQLGISRATVYDLLRRGELASVRIRNSRRIPRSALEDYIASLLAERPGEAS